MVTADSVKAGYLHTGDDEHTLDEIAKYHKDMSIDVLAAGTMKNYYTTQRYITQIVKEPKAKRVLSLGTQLQVHPGL